MTILLAKDHALEKKELFYAKIEVSMFVNFEVDHLKKKRRRMIKKLAVFWNFHVAL